MANESQLRASEIKDVLLSQIQKYDEALQAEEVDQQSGLSPAEAERRRAEFGPKQPLRGAREELA